jgi:hypothetical protein
VAASRGSVAMVNQEKAHEHPGGDEAWPRTWTATKHEKLGHMSRSDQKSCIYVALKRTFRTPLEPLDSILVIF